MEDNNLPAGCYIDNRMRFACYCMDFYSDTLDGLLAHIRPDGYCMRTGLKYVSKRDVHCICGKVFDSKLNAVLHAEYFKCMTQANSYCKKCELQFNCVANLERHYTTKRHMEGDGPVDKNLVCKACNITCWGPARMKAHLQTAKHKQRTEEGTLPLTCDVCQITCKGQKQMKAHLATAKHMKRSFKTENHEFVI